MPARILIVDDNDRDRSINASLLRGTTNEIEFAASGREALEVARRRQPDLVLLDIMMPEMDGHEVCRQLRSDPSTAELRVFMLTALDDSDSRIRAFRAGADDFITKPLHRAEILTRIQSIARFNRYRALIRFHQELARTRAEVDIGELHIDGVRAGFDRAIDKLEMWFQPIVAMSETGAKRFACESLMRCPTRPFENPLTMLAAASSLGQLRRLSAKIRSRIAEAAARIDGPLFVNLTVTELLDDDLYKPNDPLSAIAHRIVLEITEREPIGNLTDFARRVANLRKLGYRVAIDDLGGGYSSLQSLVVLEPEFAKVDRSLVEAIDGDRKKQAVVASIGGLCRELGIELIVEGVETEAERVALFDLGCRLMQGFLFGRPKPVAAD